MVDTSVQYNLTNPAFTDDIGLSNLHTMLPMAPATFGGSGGFIPGVTGSMSGTRIQGQLSNDIYQPTRKERDKAIFKKLLIAAGAITAGVLCFKGGKKLAKCIQNLFQKIKTKIKK